MIEIRDHGEIREIRLARPPVNALDPELLAGLHRQVSAAADAGARAIVLSADGKVFSAGLDLPILLTLDREGIASAWRSFYGLVSALASSPIPTVAAIQGHSPAGGAVIASFCDARIMADGSNGKPFKIGLNEVAVGLPIPWTLFLRLRQLVGSRQAERLGVGGMLVGSTEALAIGLVDRLCPSEAVVEESLTWCRRLLALPAHSMTRTRREARAEVGALFGDRNDPNDASVEAEIADLVDTWFSTEVQTSLQAVVASLGAKKG